MNTKNFILAIALFCSIFMGFGQTTDLIISEYGEGSSGSSKYIEIYNGTGGSVDLTNYALWRVSNGGTWSEATYAFTATTLAYGATIVIANNVTDTPGADEYDLGFCSWNGNDAVGLAKSGVLIDAIGTDGLDPGSGWDVAGTTNATANNTLTRKSIICSPNTNWVTSAGTNTSDSEWTVVAYSTGSANAGHTASCSVVIPTITVTPTSLTGLNYNEGSGPSTEQTFTAAGSNLTNDITLTPPANFEISLSSGSGYVSSPTTLPLAPTSGTVSTTTIYVRLKAGLGVASYSENIIADSSGATTQNVSVSGEVFQPVVTLTPTTLTSLDYVFGAGPSAEQTFTVSGVNLSGNITLSAPTNFEISLSSGSGYVSSIPLTHSSGTVASTPIYVHLAAGLAINTYRPSNITANSSFATTQNVAVSGEVIATPMPCSELFISEYIESGSDKYLEIYNPTSSSINLANYQIALYTNGSAAASSTTVLSGVLAAHTTYVIANTGATAYGGIIDLKNNTITGFNGNDAIALQTSGGTNIDVVGVIGSSADFGVDVSLVRANTVQNPVTTYNASEWTDMGLINVSNLGSHTSDCFVPTPTINVSTDGLVDLNYNIGSGPSAVQSFTVFGTNLTNDIVLNGLTDFEISLGSGGPFGSSLTLTQTSGNVASTIIYVRLKTGLAVNLYSENLAVTSSGATTKNILLEGAVLCIPTQTITNFTPLSGPVGTEVTITGTGFTAGSTVKFNGVVATATFVNTTTLIAVVPVGATTYFINVTESGCSLNSSSNFTVLNDNGCVGGAIPAGWTDLMFSGIYDDEFSSCTYIELYNPTGLDIDLSTFEIGFDNNFVYGSAAPTSGFSGLSINLSGIIASESTFMVRVSFGGSCNSCPTIVPDLSFENNSGINVDDRLVLFSGTTVKDVWENHSSRPGFLVDFNVGYIFKRNIASTAPLTSFDVVDWDINGQEDCFGFALSSAVLPTVNTQPLDTSGCYSTAFTVAATAGSGGALTYQWKYNDGSALGWTNVISSNFSPGTVIGETATNLTISGYDLDGYQFYCDVTENGTCTVSSDAAQVTTQSTTWNGSAWSVSPSISTTVVLNGNYSTVTNGSFSACSLVINTGFNLTVENSTYVEVENDVVVNGTIVVETQGSFVQNNDNGLFTINTGGIASVNKTTAPINNWYEYTYWSSPVFGETIGNALAPSPASRRFWFNAQNYLDATAEVANDNAINSGQDGIDDNGDDWQYALAADIMIPGVGYAATQSSATPSQVPYTFTGPFNNGIFNIPIYRNDSELNDLNSNFIGNPYASAISADVFLTQNVYNSGSNPSGVLDGAIYFWSHNTAPSAVLNGNEAQNFAQADYAIINASEAAGGDGVIPDRYIPSGQGFFTLFSDAASATAVSGTIMTGNVIFNNSMRVKTGNNQFFKTSNKNNTTTVTNKIWINLTSDNGVFNQLNVAYINGATNADDGSYYDAKRSVPRGMGAIIYSLIEGSGDKFVIQGKDVKSLNLKEIIYLGLNTSINAPTQYKLSIPKLEGDFVTKHPIYLKDNKFNLYHKLSNSDYSFTAEPGEYNKRFEIYFRDGSQPVNNLNPNDLVIFELNNGNVQFTVKDDLTIKNITITDILGRKMYMFKGSNYTETYNLSKLGTSVYIAKVELSNGKIIIKKAIKNL